MLTVNNSFERYSNPPPPASRFSFIVVNHVFSRAEVRTKLYNKFSYRWYLDNGIESKVGPIETPSMCGVYVRGGEGKVKSREGGAALGASIRLDSDLSLVYSFRGRNVLVLREPPPRYECSCIIYVPAVHGSRGRRRRRAASLTWLTQITLMLLEVLSYFMERPATRLFFIQIAASRLINDASRSFAAVLTRFVAGNSEQATGFSFPS